MALDQRHHSLYYILLFLPAMVLGALGMDIYVPAIPIMPEALNTTQANIQITLSIYMLGFGVGGLIFGPLSDKYGRKFILLLSLLFYVMSSFLCAISPNIILLIGLRLLQSLGGCGAMVSILAYIRDNVPFTQQPKVYSYIMGSIGVAPIIAPLVGGYLLFWFATWRACFIFLSLFSIFSFIYTWYRLEDKKPVYAKSALISIKDTKLIFRNLHFIFYSTATALAMTSLFLFFSMSSIIIIEILDISTHQFGYCFGANAILVTLGSFVAPEIEKHKGIFKVVQIGLSIILIAGISMLIFALACQLCLLYFLLPMFAASFGIGLISGPATAGALKDFSDNVGSASALLSLVRFLIPSLVGTAVMHIEITSSKPMAYSLSMIGLIGILLSFGYFKWSMLNPHGNCHETPSV